MNFETCDLPPGPSAPGVMQMGKLLRDPHGYFSSCYRLYGNTFTLRLPGRPPTVITSDSGVIQSLSGSGYDGPGRHVDEFRYLVGNNSVLFAHGEPHRLLRKAITPPFHGDRIRGYAPEMLRITDAHIELWKTGDQRQMTRESRKITLDFIVRLVLGIDDSARLERFSAAYLGYMNYMTKPLVFGLSAYIGAQQVYDYVRGCPARKNPYPMDILFRRAARNFRVVDEMLQEEIHKCRTWTAASGPARTDILAMLTTVRLEDGAAMSDAVLRDQLLTLLIGGYESSANTFSWALYCLLRHPDALARVQKEVDTVMGKQFQPEKVKELEYVDAVMSESMRLFPVALYLPRLLKESMTVGSYTLPAGIVLGPSMFLVHRDPAIWERPHEFLPERFIGGKQQVRQFFPFGLGVWRCLGAPFAELQQRIMLARLVSRFDLRLLKPDRIRPVHVGVMVGPTRGLPIQIDSIRA
ncbi:cytochrome P450 [Paraburkholderia susongensis]|uniref:Cytochrome P450 n=1 Tax=Paraburkholderia susongensis TaxID=1515439 RepID=A0A1X7HZG4_9BURK|nr:cytochrome P450 [Paraburkholderia susongensis]SMG06725.1 hypothetical protein SAMN06265784_101127 [Paraburkholderia susongensis]